MVEGEIPSSFIFQGDTMKEKIIEIRKKSSLPIKSPGERYIKFKKGDIITIKKLKVRK